MKTNFLVPLLSLQVQLPHYPQLSVLNHPPPLLAPLLSPHLLHPLTDHHNYLQFADLLLSLPFHRPLTYNYYLTNHPPKQALPLSLNLSKVISFTES